jgi:hypothetical protein
VEYTIHDPGKTIRFQLRPKDFQVAVWSHRKAKREHNKLKEDAKTLIRAEMKAKKAQVKRENRQQRDIPSIVVDSAATTTVIRKVDEDHVEVLDEPSLKIFLNANGTKSPGGMKAKLDYNLREPATCAETVSDLATNSLLSVCKTADANYITIFTKDEVKMFDAETAKVKIEGEAVMTGWRCPQTDYNMIHC